MILCLDVGNTQIFGGIFDDEKLFMTFRHHTSKNFSSDQFGLFLKSVLRENHVNPSEIRNISIGSVVPHFNHTLRNASQRYFDIKPFFLAPGTKTGLKIKYRNPTEVGADRIANSIAATHLYPNQNLAIVDLGTATTIDVVNSRQEYLGGCIMPGIRMSMESLVSNTAKLPAVEITNTVDIVGKTTVESIQSGLYYGHFYAIRGMIDQILKSHFDSNDCTIIGTGGFAHLFNENPYGDKLFHKLERTLVLKGLYQALRQNL